MQLVLQARPVSGPRRTLWLRLGQVARFGRGDQADYVFADDQTLSSLHFEVECSEDGCFLRDLRSTNGTYLNGQRISESRLYNGDQITAGGMSVDCEIEGGPPRPGPPLAMEEPPSPLDSTKGHFPPASDLVHGTRPSSGPSKTAPIPDEALQSIALHVEGGMYNDRTVGLQLGQSITVGRTDKSNVVFPDDLRMSSHHFAVDYRHDGCRVRDLGSSNGTLVNGQPISDAAIFDGDLIEAGITKFRVRGAALGKRRPE
jgi:pSer/pThr/pTyr-binding forkhead associated (FHA) protein